MCTKNLYKNIDIVGVPLYCLNIEKAVKLLMQECDINKADNKCISATGAHGMVYAQKNPTFKTLLNKFYLNLPDGMPGVWVGRAKGASKMRRCYGPDFFSSVMKESSDKSIKHFLCGGKEGVAEKLKEACEVKFQNFNIVGTFCPPFKEVEEYDYQTIADQINRSGADIVWVGISTPKQEQFAWNLSKYTKVHFLITVGAAFDFHIGNVRQAPSWMQKIGLEWLFRLLVEPKRLWRRYLEIVPLFLYHSGLDLIKYKTKEFTKK